MMQLGRMALHLSEPRFTLRQKAWRRVRQFCGYCYDFVRI